MTSRRICVIGTSHAGALKTAWDERASSTGDTATFFVAPGMSAYDLSFDGESIVPTTEKLLRSFRTRAGGLDRINVRNYDTLILCGLSGNSGLMLRLFAKHRFSDQNRWPRKPPRQLISRPLARRHVAEVVGSAFGTRIFRFWSAISPVVAIDVPAPPTCESVLDQKKAFNAAVEAVRAGYGEDLSALYEAERRHVLGAMGIRSLEVPDDILRYGLLADRRYARTKIDHGHKNSLYGLRIWEEIYRILETGTPQVPPAPAPPPAALAIASTPSVASKPGLLRRLAFLGKKP